jgi:hypothetical protein
MPYPTNRFIRKLWVKKRMKSSTRRIYQEPVEHCVYVRSLQKVKQTEYLHLNVPMPMIKKLKLKGAQKMLIRIVKDEKDQWMITIKPLENESEPKSSATAVLTAPPAPEYN